MNSIDIINRLQELNYNKDEYWVIAGAAMVLYGIKAETPDIDLGCSSKLAEILELDYTPILSPDGTRSFHIDDDIEVFENWISDRIDYIKDIPVVSINGLISMKKELSREKDLKDISLIEDFYKHKK